MLMSGSCAARAISPAVRPVSHLDEMQQRVELAARIALRSIEFYRRRTRFERRLELGAVVCDQRFGPQDVRTPAAIPGRKLAR